MNPSLGFEKPKRHSLLFRTCISTATCTRAAVTRCLSSTTSSCQVCGPRVHWNTSTSLSLHYYNMVHVCISAIRLIHSIKQGRCCSLTSWSTMKSGKNTKSRRCGSGLQPTTAKCTSWGKNVTLPRQTGHSTASLPSQSSFSMPTQRKSRALCLLLCNSGDFIG